MRSDRLRQWSGWLVPLLSSLVVVALVLGVTAAVRGGDGAGGTGRHDRDDGRVARPSTGATAEPTPEAVDLAPEDASLTGYWTRENRLVLFYELGPGCPMRVTDAAVSEGIDSVSVRLKGVLAVPDASAPCEREGRLAVPLVRQLSYRIVLDGAGGDRTVPRIR